MHGRRERPDYLTPELEADVARVVQRQESGCNRHESLEKRPTLRLVLIALGPFSDDDGPEDLLGGVSEGLRAAVPVVLDCRLKAPHATE